MRKIVFAAHRRILTAAFLLAAGCSAVSAFDRTGARPADLVIVNADIFTSNPSQPSAQALAVKGERISYVGDHAGVADFVGPETEVVDAGGKLVTPGFVDSHCHPLWIGGIGYLMPDNLFACSDFSEIAAAMKAQAAAQPGLPFVGGIGWRMDQVPGGVPHREILDGVIAERPVVLMAYSGQAGWMNTAAVKYFSGRNPAAFEHLLPVRDGKTGEFTGELRHFHSINFLDYYSWEELGSEVEEGIMRSMTRTLDSAVAVGVTSLHDVQIYPQFVPLILKFRDRGGLDKVRVALAYYVGPERREDRKKLEEDLRWWKKIGEEESGPHLALGRAIKFYIDGTVDNRTAFLLEPYADDAGNFGRPDWSQEGFNSVIELVDRMRLQACTHACGDAGIRRVVDACAAARAVNGERDSRHRVEHCEFPTPEDRERMGQLGMMASMQPAHFFGDEMVEKGLGTERMRRFTPWRSLEQAGVGLAFGSDWCNSPFNPAYGILLAATRMNYKEETDWGPEEAIPVEDTIRHWTLGSARAMFLEKEIGSLEPGKYADFVIFNTDLREITSWWFLLTRDLELGQLDDLVDLTVVGGREVYRKEDADIGVSGRPGLKRGAKL